MPEARIGNSGIAFLDICPRRLKKKHEQENEDVFILQLEELKNIVQASFARGKTFTRGSNVNLLNGVTANNLAACFNQCKVPLQAFGTWLASSCAVLFKHAGSIDK
jgi:hypothetical protein